MEIKVRDTCPKCSGTGRVMTDADAAKRARAHNESAALCHYPNYLGPADFFGCDKCAGSGKQERWMPVSELTPNVEVRGGPSGTSARL